MSDVLLERNRFRIDLAYDGRPFSGWQSQVGGDTVQDILLEAIRSVCPEVATVQGSGRTDAGVHAERQVAHFDVPAGWRMKGREWQRALNSHLPAAIRIVACGEIAPEFHARFSALEKEYRYTIVTGEVLPPLKAGLAWHQRGLPLDEHWETVLACFEGTHDFRAFSANRNDGRDEDRDTTRTIFEAEIDRASPDMAVIRYRGNGFLYKMVRFLVGTAVYCIRERIALEEIKSLLEGGLETGKAPYCAPPDGLVLQRVLYSKEFEIFDTPTSSS